MGHVKRPHYFHVQVCKLNSKNELRIMIYYLIIPSNPSDVERTTLHCNIYLLAPKLSQVFCKGGFIQAKISTEKKLLVGPFNNIGIAHFSH